MRAALKARRDAMSEIRRAETREKIALGGLVVKAGLAGRADVSKALILGVLLDGVARMREPVERARLERIGQDEFGKDRRGSAT